MKFTRIWNRRERRSCWIRTSIWINPEALSITASPARKCTPLHLQIFNKCSEKYWCVLRRLSYDTMMRINNILIDTKSSFFYVALMCKYNAVRGAFRFRKYFINDSALTAHFKGNPHKRRWVVCCIECCVWSRCVCPMHTNRCVIEVCVPNAHKQVLHLAAD